MGDPAIPVRGTLLGRRPDMLVLSQRLDGHDTFLTGTLEVGGRTVNVRILTLDDVTVLRLGATTPVDPEWAGVLHLRHGARTPRPPADLTDLARERRRDLTALDEADLRYSLAFLNEATTADIRRQRAEVIVGSLPEVGATPPAGP